MVALSAAVAVAVGVQGMVSLATTSRQAENMAGNTQAIQRLALLFDSLSGVLDEIAIWVVRPDDQALDAMVVAISGIGEDDSLALDEYLATSSAPPDQIAEYGAVTVRAHQLLRESFLPAAQANRTEQALAILTDELQPAIEESERLAAGLREAEERAANTELAAIRQKERDDRLLAIVLLAAGIGLSVGAALWSWPTR